MATDNKIVWFGLGAVAAVLLLRYYNKNKGLMVGDIKSDAANLVKGAQDNLKATTTPLLNTPIVASDLVNRDKRKVIDPIYVPVRNQIPTRYDTGIGEDIFQNMTGPTTPTSLQGACKCSGKQNKNRKMLNINPELL
jgi:hypothetical protein